MVKVLVNTNVAVEVEMDTADYETYMALCSSFHPDDTTEAHINAIASKYVNGVKDSAFTTIDLIE